MQTLTKFVEEEGKKKIVVGFDFLLLSQTEEILPFSFFLVFLGSFVCSEEDCWRVRSVLGAFLVVVCFSLFLVGCRLGKLSLSFFLVQKFYNL
jgi:hypothetical protein